MRILYFHQHFSTLKGASGNRSYWMAKRLVDLGHDVTMICGSYRAGDTGLSGPFTAGVRQGDVDGFRVVEFGLAYSNADGFLKRSWTFVIYSLCCIGIALFNRYDIAFCTSTPLTAAIPGIVARWFRGKRFVFEVRDLWPELPREMGVITNPLVLGLMSALEWLGYRSASRLIGLSPGIVRGIERRGKNPGSIALIPNGCDLNLFDRRGASSWRPEGVGSDDLMAIYTGTHGLANGLDAVLDAARVLKRRQRDDIKLVLVGDGKLKAALQERARREQLHNVVFCSPVSKVKLVDLMAGSDLGMQILADVPAFYYGTSPNKFFDYIASGLPVLNNYPGWVADMIRKHDCGFAVPPGDPDAFADSLVIAAERRVELKEMGLRALKLAREEFDRENLADQFADWVTKDLD